MADLLEALARLIRRWGELSIDELACCIVGLTLGLILGFGFGWIGASL